jgi:hypothetical protein
MASPMQFDIPHSLGREEAKRRIERGIPKLGQHIPGGGEVQAVWPTPYELQMGISAMGQKVAADLVIEEDRIRANVAVPLMLSMMAGAISGFVKTSAEKMLAPPSPDKA